MKEFINKLYHPASASGDTLGKTRNYYLDNLKFVLIILVVCGHFAMKLAYVNEIKYLMYFIYIFHMPCFIFVNGYLAKRMNEGGKLRADKILVIFWLYLLFKFGDVLLGLAFGHHVKLSLFKDTSAPWYLLTLGIWYLAIPLMERIKTHYLIAGSFLIGLGAGYINSIGTVMSLSRVMVFFPFFVVGFCLSGKLDRFLDKKLRVQAFALLIAVLAGMVLFWKQLEPFKNILYGASPYSSSLGKLAKYGFLVRGIWYLLAIAVSGAFLLLIPRCRMFFSVLGERTLQVYMTHIWVRNALVYAGFFVFIKDSPHYLTLLVLIGSVILAFLLSNRWLKKLFDILMAPKLFEKLLK